MTETKPLLADLLPPEEWPKLQQILIDEFVEPLPDPNKERIVAVKDGEEIIGFAQVELVPHVRHVHLNSEYQGSGVREALIAYLVSLFPKGKRAVLLTDRDAGRKLAEDAGMVEYEGTTYVKDF